MQGSGWGALAWEPLGERLFIEQIYDHQGNVGQGGMPLLVIDAWEHAYYLQYKNVRADYVEGDLEHRQLGRRRRPASTGRVGSSSDLEALKRPAARRPDDEDHSLAPDRARVVFFEVLARQFVDVTSGAVTTHDVDDVAPHLRVLVRVLGVPDHHRHPRVVHHVDALLTVELCIDQHVIVVGIDPHHVRRRVSRRPKGGEPREVLPLREVSELRARARAAPCSDRFRSGWLRPG